MGIELARAFIRTQVDNTDLAGGFAETTRQTLAGLADARAFAIALLSPLALIGNQFLATGRAGAIFSEDTFVALKRMIGSAEETQETMARLTEFAADTPFEMPQLLQVTRELVNFGERGDEMMDTLKMLGDASGGTADKFGLLGIVFNQIRGAGRLTRQDFMQLSTRGIISLKELGDALGKSSEETNAMLSSGKISFEMFREALATTTQEGGKNFNAMAEASLTLSGRISTLSDAQNILARKVAEALVPWEKFTTEVKIKVISALDAFVTASDGAAASMTVGAIKAATFGAMLLAGGKAAKFFGISLKTAMIGTGIGAGVVALGAAIGWMTNWMAKSEPIIAAVTDQSSKLSEAWDILVTAGKSLMLSFDGMFEAVFGTTMEEALGLAEVSVAGWIDWFGEILVWGAEKVAEFADWIGFYIRNGVDIAKIAMIDMSTSVLTFVLGSTENIEAWASAWFGVWEGMKAFFVAWADNIGEVFSAMVGSILAEIKALLAAADALIAGDNPLTAYSKTRNEEYQKVADEFEMTDPFTAYTETRDEAIKRAMEGFAEFDILEGMEAEKQKLLDSIAQREAAHKAAMDEAGAPEAEDSPKKKKEKEKDEAGKKGGADDLTGRYDFKAFGTAIQDAMLKNKDSENLGKMVSIGQQGNALQEKVLEAVKEQKEGLAP